MNIEINIEFGKEYKDSISGFKGTATAVASYWHGVDQVQLTAKQQTDMAEPVEAWFNASRLTPV